MAVTGRVVLVTGSSKGIGAALARAFAAAGADVAVHYRSSTDEARAVRESILARGTRASVFRADVRDRGEVEAMVAGVLSEFGRLDILVNNAGVASRKPILDITDDEWDEMMDTHVKGAFNCCRAVLPHMLDRRFGRIVTITALAGKSGLPPAGVHYCAAKAALIGFTKSLAHQVAATGITVNAVALGQIDTPSVRWRTPAEIRDLEKAIPVGRLGNLDEVCEAVLFAASDSMGFMTGETINVNGGVFMD